MDFLTLVAALGAIAPAQSVAPAAPSATSCVMTPAERDWIGGNLAAWDRVRTRFTRLPRRSPRIILFNDRCRFDGVANRAPVWRGYPHGGKIVLPAGGEVGTGVTSFAAPGGEGEPPFFVMALPSVWVSAKAFADPADAELRAIFLHEFSHVAHLSVLGPAFARAEVGFKAADNLTDDTIQERWSKVPAYARSIEKERDLLFAAASEPDDRRARRLAAQAHRLMKIRQQRFFSGRNKGWKAYDDLFLTMEGIGQWTAFAWLADPAGGRMSRERARDTMRGSRRWWSQDQGLALFMTIDRLFPQWPDCALRRDPVLGIDLLAIAARGGTCPTRRN